MKAALFLIVLLATALPALAMAQEDLDDLQTIDLNLEVNQSPLYTVQYPGYRLGGGTPPRMRITDCLILDVKNSDQVITNVTKMNLAKRLIVEDGFRLGNDEAVPKLKAELKGNNVVFRLVSESAYLTQIHVKTKDGKSLQANLDEALPAATPVGLVYVRACRF
ncbi:MAG: hypothetical protein V4598_05300 [Bdellovibrionota bacterium]